MNDTIDINSDDIRSHASSVDADHSGVQMAADAAGSVNLFDGAFGLMCTPFLPPIISPLTTSVSQAIQSVADEIDGTVIPLRDMATAFDTTDDDASVEFEGVDTTVEV
ncbi:type VII secretion target [Georgenia sp. Z1344]|uniref:type VII secretion target n=1 Tax=Georgenia sp. Z1344 TaxID=3416706 RepID=UPI003CF5A18E